MRSLQGRAVEGLVEAGQSECQGPRSCLLRRRPWTAGRGLPATDVQGGAAVRAEYHAGKRNEAGAVARLRSERRSIVALAGIPVAAGYARLVRRVQCEVARGSASAGRPLSGKLPGSLVPVRGWRGRDRRGQRSADAVGGDRDHTDALEVGDRTSPEEE